MTVRISIVSVSNATMNRLVCQCHQIEELVKAAELIFNMLDVPTLKMKKTGVRGG